MKGLFSVILFLFVANTLFGQDCDCRTDLSEFRTAYTRTISYKKQSKNSEIEKQFMQTYDSLQNSISCQESQWDCFLKLTTLKDVIRDEHSRVMAHGPKNEETPIEQTTFYKQLPDVSCDLDSLQQALQQKPFDAVEGVYYSENATYGVVSEGSGYNGIVLKTTLPSWKPGMVAFELRPARGDKYRVAWIPQEFSGFRSLNAERIVNGRFLIMNIAKDVEAPYYYAPADTETFFYEALSEDIGYMRIETFSWKNGNVDTALAFFEKTFPNISATHLILDLRHNGGGTDQIGKPLRKAVKKYAKKNKVHILVNGRSGSNAEQTTQVLRKTDNVTVYGDRTMGIINYGLNYGEKVVLPSGRFSFFLTDLDYKDFMEYESFGIPVDKELATDSDWIEQLLNVIQE